MKTWECGGRSLTEQTRDRVVKRGYSNAKLHITPLPQHATWGVKVRKSLIALAVLSASMSDSWIIPMYLRNLHKKHFGQWEMWLQKLGSWSTNWTMVYDKISSMVWSMSISRTDLRFWFDLLGIVLQIKHWRIFCLILKGNLYTQTRNIHINYIV